MLTINFLFDLLYSKLTHPLLNIHLELEMGPINQSDRDGSQSTVPVYPIGTMGTCLRPHAWGGLVVWQFWKFSVLLISLFASVDLLSKFAYVIPRNMAKLKSFIIPKG